MSDEEDEFGFDKEQIDPVVQKVVNEVLVKEVFDETRVQMLIDTICEKIMADLANLGLPMKFAGKKSEAALLGAADQI